MDGTEPTQDLATLVEIGDSLLANGDPEGSLRAFDAALSADPESTAALLGSASAFGTLGVFDEAYRYLDVAVAVGSEEPEVWATATAVALTAGDAQTAREAAEQRLELGDRDVDALLDMAAAAFYSLDMENAAAAVDEALAIAPGDAETLGWREMLSSVQNEHEFLVQVARAHCRDGRLDQGLAILDRALDVGDSYDAHLYAGRALLAAGDAQSAIEQFGIAEDFASDDPAALLGLGEAGAQVGRTDVVRWAAERLLASYPDSDQARALLEWAEDAESAPTEDGLPARPAPQQPMAVPAPPEQPAAEPAPAPGAFCYQCGARCRDDARFCVRCGARRL